MEDTNSVQNLGIERNTRTRKRRRKERNTRTRKRRSEYYEISIRITLTQPRFESSSIRKRISKAITSKNQEFNHKEEKTIWTDADATRLASKFENLNRTEIFARKQRKIRDGKARANQRRG